MRPIFVLAGILLLPVTVLSQTIDIEQHRFTDDVEVLSPGGGLVAVGSLNEVVFLYRGNGRGLFATEPEANWRQMANRNSWAVGCRKDAMDDSVACTLTREDLTVLKAGDRLVVLVGGNHYPGTGVAIRIDDEAAIQSEDIGFEEPMSIEIIDQLLSADRVTTRFQEWPRRGFVDKSIDLYGFPEAFAFLNWIIDRVD